MFRKRLLFGLKLRDNVVNIQLLRHAGGTASDGERVSESRLRHMKHVSAAGAVSTAFKCGAITFDGNMKMRAITEVCICLQRESVCVCVQVVFAPNTPDSHPLLCTCQSRRA